MNIKGRAVLNFLALSAVTHDSGLNPDITRDASGAWLKAKGARVPSMTDAAAS